MIRTPKFMLVVSTFTFASIQDLDEDPDSHDIGSGHQEQFIVPKQATVTSTANLLKNSGHHKIKRKEKTKPTDSNYEKGSSERSTLLIVVDAAASERRTLNCVDLAVLVLLHSKKENEICEENRVERVVGAQIAALRPLEALSLLQ
ncbi:Hypothetical predicted protein [Olea europaea subsp. europaea]|uniref:Uncharacterized protein n=1 Tax=Olea europaea subsp. europaea TaxID=158383 RepID=A0A8S0R5L5_OLEEU|nr:Hypothetical predicted protein [Olea europaea subsp. europaea]